MNQFAKTDKRARSTGMRFALYCFVTLAAAGLTLLSFGERGTATAAENTTYYGYCTITQDLGYESQTEFYSSVFAVPGRVLNPTRELNLSFSSHVDANHPKPDPDRTVRRWPICDVPHSRSKRSDAVDAMNRSIANSRRLGAAIIRTGWSPAPDLWD